MSRTPLVLLLALVHSFVVAHQEFENQQWTPDFAVELKGDSVEAQLILTPHGFEIVRSIGQLNVHHVRHPDACTKKHRCKRHAEDLVALLKKDSRVTRVEQQFVLERDFRAPVSQREEDADLERARWLEEKASRSAAADESDQEYKRQVIARHARLAFDFNDPLFQRQWHLDNFGQIANAGLDLNLLPAWRKNYWGQGSKVTVVDDGIDTHHPDLKKAYDPFLSADLNDPTDVKGNPRGPARIQPVSDGHGTECAGEIAASPNNSVCGSGVAPGIKLGGVRVLAGKVTDLQEAFSVLHQHNVTEVYSCSWGPTDNGKKFEMPHHYTGMGLRISATRGRNGLGNIFSFASGNGGARGDNCGPDGYSNAPYTISMGAINIYGRSVFYGERCAAIMAAAPVGGKSAPDARFGPEKFARISTTAINNRCSTRFAGTSAAAPLGAACMALVLQANRNLTWRDVQHVVALTSRIPNDQERVWQKNGAGYHVSHHFGFGLLDCSKAVKAAQTWTNVPPQKSCKYSIAKGKDKLYAGRSRRYTFSLTACGVGSVEHALVRTRISHKLRGDVEIWLISPAGTVSRLLGRRFPDKSSKGIQFTFLTRFLMGESPLGRWTLEVRDLGLRKTRGRVRGVVHLAELQILGTAVRPAHMAARKQGKAQRLSLGQIRRIFEKERQESLNVFPEHRDVLELKRSLSGATRLDGKVMEQVKSLMQNEDVSREEIRSLVDLVKDVEKKLQAEKKQSASRKKAEKKEEADASWEAAVERAEKKEQKRASKKEDAESAEDEDEWRK